MRSAARAPVARGRKISSDSRAKKSVSRGSPETSWRWTLYVNLIFAILAVFGAMTFLHRSRGEKQRLDILGAVLGGAGLFALVYGFSRAEPEGWDSAQTWGPLVAAGVLLVAFVLRQRMAGTTPCSRCR